MRARNAGKILRVAEQQFIQLYYDNFYKNSLIKKRCYFIGGNDRTTIILWGQYPMWRRVQKGGRRRRRRK